ncbi:MAG: hypothetical protein GOV02_04065 [Candidatus Aenigmarchaeota archaeon]|nr:hypothetical protein [Candidatus Aenigmarchaeota archaeon]
MKIYINKNIIPVFTIMILVVLFVSPYEVVSDFKDCEGNQSGGIVKGICIGDIEMINKNYEYDCSDVGEGIEAFSRTNGVNCLGFKIETERLIG